MYIHFTKVANSTIMFVVFGMKRLIMRLKVYNHIKRKVIICALKPTGNAHAKQ